MRSSDPSILDPADPDPRARARLAEWLAFQRHFGPDPRAGRKLLASAGGPGAALRARGVEPPPAPEAADLDALRTIGARGVARGSTAYPRRLAPLPEAPPLLWLRGDPDVLDRPAVALVGARAATAYGLDVAASLAAALARRGVVVVSGLARGIDAAAHRAALEAGGRSIGVQACGPERVYPREHAGLASALAAAGAVLSEFPPGTPPLRPFFPLRNRLISGLSQLVVVVEARERSGSLVTARHALEQGVEVMAVPGPIDRAAHRGSNALLRDGAAPVLGPEDVLDRLGPVLESDASAGAPPTGDGGGLSPGARSILGALESAPQTRDDLCRALAVEPSALASDLLDLELRGRVRRDRDGTWRAIGTRGASRP